MKHTPGPWTALEYAGYYSLQNEEGYSENDLLNEERDKNAPANARLAAAAPDLLEALEGLVKDVKSKHNDTRYATHIKIAEEAIKKATE